MVFVLMASRGHRGQLSLGTVRGKRDHWSGRSLVAVEGPELKESYREAEPWHHEENSLLAKVQPSCHRDPRILETPAPWNDHQGQQQSWSAAKWSLEDKLRVLHRVEPRDVTSPFGGA